MNETTTMADRDVRINRKADEHGNVVWDIVVNGITVDTIFRDPANRNWYSIFPLPPAQRRLGMFPLISVETLPVIRARVARGELYPTAV